MGISVQQYRAAIGNWFARRLKQTSVCAPITQVDPTRTHGRGHVHSVLLQGPWKVHAVLLSILAVTFFLISHSYVNITVGCSTTALPPSTGHTSAWKDQLDFAVAAGNRIVIQCQRTLLIVGGVVPSPGPNGSDKQEETVEKQENIIAQLCFDAPNLDVRNCLRLYIYNSKNSIRQHKTEFNKCQKAVIVNTLDYLWPCGVVVASLPHTQEDPGSTPGRGSYLRQVSLH